MDEAVDAYIHDIPPQARKSFDELRRIVQVELPQAHEVMSYGVVGYKPDIKKRAVVFIGGWHDHIALYPIPRDEALRRELQPYIHGKGTLWFHLDQPLPKSLLQKTVGALVGR